MAEYRILAEAGAVDARSQIACRVLRGLVPTGYRPASYRQRLERLANSGRVMPDQLKVLESTISAIDAAVRATRRPEQ